MPPTPNTRQSQRRPLSQNVPLLPISTPLSTPTTTPSISYPQLSSALLPSHGAANLLPNLVINLSSDLSAGLETARGSKRSRKVEL